MEEWENGGMSEFGDAFSHSIILSFTPHGKELAKVNFF